MLGRSTVATTSFQGKKQLKWLLDLKHTFGWRQFFIFVPGIFIMIIIPYGGLMIDLTAFRKTDWITDEVYEVKN